jgi:hypothetical protein
MSSTDSVVQLLNQILAELRVVHDENKALKDQLTALQSVPASKPRGKAASSNPVGVGANGQPEKKFPNNTIVWLKAKANEDPNFLPQLLGQSNYDSFALKYAAEIKNEDPKEQPGKLAEKVWKDLGALADNSPHPPSKDFAVKMTDHLRKTWKAEKTAWEAAQPTALTQSTTGTIMPDTPALVTPQMQTLSFDSPVLSQPLLTPVSFSLPLVQPIGASAFRLGA